MNTLFNRKVLVVLMLVLFATITAVTVMSQSTALNVKDSSDNSLLYVEDTGNVGIGITTPDAKLQVRDGSVLFDGTTGVTPVSGAGTRLMWIPSKAAFRAGLVNGTQWDDANVERWSFATGKDTTASGDASTAMGFFTTASGNASTAMGDRTTASGISSTAMGAVTTASGNASTAMGAFASTNMFAGTFVYGDNSTNTVMDADVANQFKVRASGGTIFYSNSGLTTGVQLAAGGGSWSSVSDRNRKENFSTEDGELVLKRIKAMPIESWNYKSQDPSIRHLGPTAQDFYAAFGLGESETRINTVDIDGVNMLAIQALERRTAELEQVKAELRELKAENALMKAKMAGFESTLQRLEALATVRESVDDTEAGEE